jgi:hypothetical protein
MWNGPKVMLKPTNIRMKFRIPSFSESIRPNTFGHQ